MLHDIVDNLKGWSSSGAVVVQTSHEVSLSSLCGSVLQRLDRLNRIASTSIAPRGVSLSARIRRLLESGGQQSKLQHSHRRPCFDMFGHEGDGSEEIPSLSLTTISHGSQNLALAIKGSSGRVLWTRAGPTVHH